MRAVIPESQVMQARQRLPGIRPVGQADWITVDANYADQLAEKARLVAECRDRVYGVLPAAEAPAAELLDEVLLLLRGRAEFVVQGSRVTCPDGRVVDVAVDDPPLLILSRLLQEDVCIHVKVGEAHHLVGASLCFPASWTLAEKLGKPLVGVHGPVPEYDDNLARRVQRLFDGVQVGHPIWRANWHRYADPDLFQPKLEATPRPPAGPDARFERSERQTLLRLPRTGAVVFAIHTTVAPRI